MSGSAFSKMPASIKIALGLLALVAVSKGFDVVTFLWRLPQLFQLNLSAATVIWSIVNLLISVAVLILVVMAWRWTWRRDNSGRWGLLLIIALSMIRVGSSASIDQPASSVEFKVGELAGMLVVWLALLILGLRIIFGAAVKAYFAPPVSPAPNTNTQQSA